MCARVLIVTSNHALRELCERSLDGIVETRSVNSMQAAMDAVESDKLSSILLDPKLPDCIAEVAIEHINRTFWGIPTVMLHTSEVSQRLIDAAYARGLDSQIELCGCDSGRCDKHDTIVAVEHIRQSVNNSFGRSRWVHRWPEGYKGKMKTYG